MTYKIGDRVKYASIGNAPNSATTGRIIDVITKTRRAYGTAVRIKASKDDPRYIIKNDNTGKDTAYKQFNIIGHANL